LTCDEVECFVPREEKRREEKTGKEPIEEKFDRHT